MADAAHPLPLDQTGMRSGRRAAITVAVMLATLLQVLDTTIANVALPYMRSSLGATPETINWVLTSYIVASAISIPITGWLTAAVGRKRLFTWAVIGFTFFSVLCAVAGSLTEMVLFRAAQGIAGAFIVPLSQAVLFDINPPERHARAMALFGGGVMIGPILGPVLGGWLTQYFSWRWVFLVNLPVGIFAAFMLIRFLPSGERHKMRFDMFGFALLAIAVGSLQMMLDRGQQLDWFDSWEVMIEAFLAIGAFWMFVVHMLSAREPVLPPAIFRDRTFVSSLLFMAVTGVLLLAGLALLPPLLQSLFGYSVLDSGFLTAPRGVGTLISMTMAGRLVGRIDARLLIFTGVLLMAYSLWQMSGFTLEMDQRPIIVTGVIQGLGMGLMFVPLQTLAFSGIDPRNRTTAASLFNLARSVGGSVGISVMTTLLARNQQTSHADLAAHVTSSTISALPPQIGSVAPITDRAIAMMDAEVNRQAAMIAYIDDFHLMMLVCLAASPLLLLLRKPKARAAPDAHAAVME
jgi:MFS transporter, DHA2 family, multidrug resistance protein